MTDAIPARWADVRHCRWPEDMGPPSAYFASLNEPHLQGRDHSSYEAEPHSGAAAGRSAQDREGEALTISVSHFVPRRDLLPPEEFLRFRELPRVAGSPLIEAQLRAAGSDLHVFGHSHIRRDLTIDGVRYVQHALGYPRERREPEAGPKQIV
jgi:hypothetical protein